MAEAEGYPSGLRAAVMAGEAALERGPNHGLVCLEPRHLVALLSAARLELAGSIVRPSEGADAPSEAPAHAQAARTDAGVDGEARAVENVAPAADGMVGFRRVWVVGGRVSVDYLGDVAQRAHVALPVPDGRVLELSQVGLEWALLEHAYRWSDAWLVEWGSPVGEYAPQPKVLPLRPDLPIAPLADAQDVPLAQDWPGRGLEAVLSPVGQREAARQQAMAAALADAPQVVVLAAALLGTEGRVDVPPDDDECVTRAVRMWQHIVRELRDGGVS